MKTQKLSYRRLKEQKGGDWQYFVDTDCHSEPRSVCGAVAQHDDLVVIPSPAPFAGLRSVQNDGLGVQHDDFVVIRRRRGIGGIAYSIWRIAYSGK